MRQPNSKRTLAIAALLGGLAVFPSCLETKNPVTAAQEGGQDKGLCGAWKYREKDGTLWLLQFGFLDGEFKSPWMCCTASTTSGTEHSSSSTACFVSRLDGVHFLNLADDLDMPLHQMSADPELPGKIHKYTVLKYELQDGKLLLTTTDDDFIKKAIAGGRIEGRGTLITASSASLAAFLQKEHLHVFPPKNTVEFIKL
jgi:hypothetical protein